MQVYDFINIISTFLGCKNIADRSTSTQTFFRSVLTSLKEKINNVIINYLLCEL